MACINCNKIRAAILHGKMAEAAGLTVEALREKLGLKEGQLPGGIVPAHRGLGAENDVPEVKVPGSEKAVIKVK